VRREVGERPIVDAEAARPAVGEIARAVESSCRDIARGARKDINDDGTTWHIP
jgi:hypothetical protein